MMKVNIFILLKLDIVLVLLIKLKLMIFMKVVDLVKYQYYMMSQENILLLL